MHLQGYSCQGWNAWRPEQKLVSPFDWLAWTNARDAGLLEARSCCESVKATYILNISVLTTKALTSRVWKGSSLSEIAGPRPRLVGEVTWRRSRGGRRAHRRGRKRVRGAGRTEARQAWCRGRGRPRRRRRWGSGWPSARGGVGWSAAPVWRSSSGMRRTRRRRRTCCSPGEKQNGLPFEITTALLAIGLTRSDTLHCVTCPIWSGLEPRGGGNNRHNSNRDTFSRHPCESWTSPFFSFVNANAWGMMVVASSSTCKP